MNSDRISELYAGKVFSREVQNAARERIHWVCQQAQGEKVLDMGCSQGIVCLLLAREGFQCIGIDCEKEAIEYALEERSKEEDPVQERVQFKVGDAACLEFQDASFDTVIMGEILEHLTHPEKVLMEAKRLLKDGGKAIITVPLGLNPDPDHKRTYYPASFLETVQPFFRTVVVDLFDNYIAYCGGREVSSGIETIPQEDLLREKLRLHRATEGRTLSKEQELLLTATEHHEQIGKLHEQVSGLSKKNREFLKTLQTREREFKEILQTKEREFKERLLKKDTEHKEILQTRERECEERLLQKDSESKQKGLEYKETVLAKDSRISKFQNQLKTQEDQFRQKMSSQEKMYTHAWKWRIGSVFVDGFVLVRDFFKSPFQFIKHAGSHFRKYYSAINPNVSSSVPAKILSNVPSKGTTTPRSTMPAPSKIRQPPKPKFHGQKASIGCVFDEFTAACFQPECRMITFRPDNWQEILERNCPHAVFVESAWRGNEGAWQYRVAKYQKNMGDELVHLLDWARNGKIPSIFWNKEDPAHFDRFIEKAKFFDYVFTSDVECVAEYRKELGHDRIFPLPFAAQPRIHNPVLDHERKHSVSFAGTYYGGSHEERKHDMEILLKPALDFGLDIYDRQFGITGPDSAQFRFPDIYQPAIKGRLEYEDMLKAYKNYKVFLNVNSIKTSPTMFSRRVFELLACGTPVISSYSKGIEELLGGDLVFIVETEEDTRAVLEKLLGSDEYWATFSVRGIRKVMEKHTYNERLRYVLDKIGLSLPPLDLPMFSVASIIKDVSSLRSLQESLVRQKYRNFEIVLVADPDSLKEVSAEFKNALPDHKVSFVPLNSKQALGDYFRSTGSSYLAIFDSKDYYGPNYLKDFALSTFYAQSKYLGKGTHFVYDSDKPALAGPGSEFRFASQVPVSTVVVRKEAMTPDLFYELIGNEMFEPKEENILSLDRFNYIKKTPGRTLPERLLEPIGI